MATSGSFNTSGYDGRYLTFSWSVTGQSVENNTTTISWTLKGAGGNAYNFYQARNIKVTIDGNVVYSFPQANGYIDLNVGTVVASGTYPLTHKEDGTKTFSAYVEAGIYNWAVNCTGSGTFTLDQIKRRSVIAGTNGTLGSSNTLTLTRYNSAFTDTITATCGTASVTIATGSTAGSIKWTPPVDWASQNVNATSVTATISCKTYNGAALLGETSVILTFAIPASVVPTVSLAVSDAMGYLATYGSYIQNKSQAKVTATGAGVYGSTIKSYAIVCGTLSGTGASGTFNLPESGKITIKVTATDSRGRSASASTTISVTAYSAPTAEITSRYRCNANGNENYLGTYAIAVFRASVTSLGGKNSASYALKYRVRGTTSWTSIAMGALSGNYAPSGASQIFPASIDKSYDVCIAASDHFGTIESAYRTIQLGSPIMDADRNNRALAFFQRAVDANTVAFGLSAKFNEQTTFGKEIYPPAIEMKPGSNAGHGGYIDFHHNNSTADYTSRICEYTSGQLTVSGNLAVQGTLYSGGVTVPKVIAVIKTISFESGIGTYSNSLITASSVPFAQFRAGSVATLADAVLGVYPHAGYITIVSKLGQTGSLPVCILVIIP